MTTDEIDQAAQQVTLGVIDAIGELGSSTGDADKSLIGLMVGMRLIATMIIGAKGDQQMPVLQAALDKIKSEIESAIRGGNPSKLRPSAALQAAVATSGPQSEPAEKRLTQEAYETMMMRAREALREIFPQGFGIVLLALPTGDFKGLERLRSGFYSTVSTEVLIHLFEVAADELRGGRGEKIEL